MSKPKRLYDIQSVIRLSRVAVKTYDRNFV